MVPSAEPLYGTLGAGRRARELSRALITSSAQILRRLGNPPCHRLGAATRGV